MDGSGGGGGGGGDFGVLMGKESALTVGVRDKG